jgi:hypothetical protein
VEGKGLGGLGWERDLADFRDLTAEGPSMGSVLPESRPSKAAKSQVPEAVYVSKYWRPIENQGSLGSCTASRGEGLLENFPRRAFDKHTSTPRAVPLQGTRNLLGQTGDQGAYPRTIMKALTLFGVP